MNRLKLKIFLLSIFNVYVVLYSCVAKEQESKLPTILIVLLVRNKAHALPYFLGHLEQLNYPKDKISLWIRTDHNVDQSRAMLEEWLAGVQASYRSANINTQQGEEETDFPDALGVQHWSEDHFTHIMKLRQQGLEYARKQKVDRVFFLDADVMLFNEDVLSILVSHQQTVLAPMLDNGNDEESGYSNFWGGFDDAGFFNDTPGYFPIKNRIVQGCVKVAMVHAAVMVNIQNSESKKIRFYPPPEHYKGPYDDLVILGHITRQEDIPMYVVNTHYFGTMVMPFEDPETTLDNEIGAFLHVLLKELAMHNQTIYRTPHISQQPKTNFTFDKIFIINLKRREDRRRKMETALDILGIEGYEFIEAVDANELSPREIKSLGIEVLPGYFDPYHKRPMKTGEVACFLSHYKIWKKVVDKKYEKVVVFEDDVRFSGYFNYYMEACLRETKENGINWDLIYLGRKPESEEDEEAVPGSELFVYASYSYWMLGYMLSYSGAQKLTSQAPLQKMLPTDEYVPIMIDKHPNEEWKSYFSPRNLIGLSFRDVIIEPTFYSGHPWYVSDTEDSTVLKMTDEDTKTDSKTEDKKKTKTKTKTKNKKKAKSKKKTNELRGETMELNTNKDEL